MNQKLKITKIVAEQLERPIDDKSLDTLRQVIWTNPRVKKKGGLRLTDEGYHSLLDADIKSHRVVFEEPIFLSNALLLWMDNNIDCPFYLTSKEVYFFGERMAIQLILFSGNLQKLHRAHKRSSEMT